MSRLDKLWHKFMPGTKEDFLKFLGVTETELEDITFVGLERLPKLKGHIQPLGGRPAPRDRVAFDWKVIARSRNLEHGQVFVGRGDNYHDAALHGIMALYEMVTHRRGCVAKSLGRKLPQKCLVKEPSRSRRRGKGSRWHPAGRV